MAKKKISRRIGKMFVLVGVGALLLGNQKCEQKPEAARKLKKIVEMGVVRSSPVILNGGSSFDFEYVANQQLYGVIAESGDFAIRTAPTILANPNEPSLENPINLTPGDMKLVEKSMAEANQSDFRAQFSRTAWCMVNLPQAKLGGSINSFELKSRGGLTIGFSDGTAIETGYGAEGSFDVESAQLDMSMYALPPLGRSRLADVNVTSKQTKTQVNFRLDLGQFVLGPRYYYQTPLATVTKRALELGVRQLSESMQKDNWYTRVFMDHDTHVTIVGGRDVNLEVGDRLRIYNEEYAWSGEPCDSEYLGSVGLGEDSFYATVEVVSVGDELSRVKVVQFAPNSMQKRALVGGKVVLEKLFVPLSEESSAKTKKKK